MKKSGAALRNTPVLEEVKDNVQNPLYKTSGEVIKMEDGKDGYSLKYEPNNEDIDKDGRVDPKGTGAKRKEELRTATSNHFFPNKPVGNKLYSAIDELLNNTIKYGVKEGFVESSAERNGDYITLSISNTIAENSIEDFTQRLDYINSLSKDEVKELYRESLDRNKVNTTDGAGLGLVDAARKNKEDGIPVFKFNFQKTNTEGLHIFTLEVNIKHSIKETVDNTIEQKNKAMSESFKTE